MTEYRDPYTAGISLVLQDWAVEIGKHLELEPHRLLGLEIAASCMTLGKFISHQSF
jgi:HD-GYP domain-containing protein (c-di-GMP phosphodiesterase class II)